MVTFKSYPWEGKGWKYYWKDTLRHRPVMLPYIPLLGIIAPIGYFCLKHQDETKFLEFSRYRYRYIVYRDDDPRVSKIIKYDDKGNRIYLEPRTN